MIKFCGGISTLCSVQGDQSRHLKPRLISDADKRAAAEGKLDHTREDRLCARGSGLSFAGALDAILQ